MNHNLLEERNNQSRTKGKVLGLRIPLPRLIPREEAEYLHPYSFQEDEKERSHGMNRESTAKQGECHQRVRGQSGDKEEQ